MRRFTAVTIIALAVLFLGPGSADAALNKLKSTYYSDYFVTQVGYAIGYCDDTTEYVGTQSGAYLKNEKWNCNTGSYGKWCYQNVGGSYVMISCP